MRTAPRTAMARHPVIPIQAVADTGEPLFAADARIHPRSVKGMYARWRWAMVWLTQVFFYGMPWLNWHGRQALLFDVEGGQFYVGSLVMFPQDFIYLAALLVLSALALFFFTAVAGRLWCGYACPQTVYTEIFLWIEHRFEGDRLARMRLDDAPWSPAKLLRRGGKHGAWLLLAGFTGISFVGYFTPIRVLSADLLAGAASGWSVFWLLFYAAATYGNAGFLREQMCKYICPYARFQSALIDRDSMIISYDRARGEPRGSRPRGVAAVSLARGDCVDCTLCVQVCPTGIDIRNGLQNECIGCAACIDACNGVMDKLGAPRGLIRYATENGMQHHWSHAVMVKRVLRPRVLIYGLLLSGLAATFVVNLATRPPLRVNVIKDRNTLARQTEDGQIENIYRVQVMNLTEAAQTLHVSAQGATGLQVITRGDPALAAAGMATFTASVQLPQAQAAALAAGSHPIRLVVQARPAGVVEGSVAGAVDAAAAHAAEVSAVTTFYLPR